MTTTCKDPTWQGYDYCWPCFGEYYLPILNEERRKRAKGRWTPTPDSETVCDRCEQERYGMALGERVCRICLEEMKALEVEAPVLEDIFSVVTAVQDFLATTEEELSAASGKNGYVSYQEKETQYLGKITASYDGKRKDPIQTHKKG